MSRSKRITMVIAAVVLGACAANDPPPAAAPSTLATVVTTTTTAATAPPSTTAGPTTADAGTTTTAAPTTTTTTEPEPEPFPGVPPIPDDVPMPPVDQFGNVSLTLEPVLDLRYLTGMEWSVLEQAYYAITQDGRVHRVAADLASSELVLDLTAEVTERLPGSERGLLGIAFDPRDGRMFLHFTDRGNDTNLVSFAMRDGVPDPASRRAVLFQEQPGLGHQGGRLQFDADGQLYVALGDGGGSRGRDAQDVGSLHGSILRILPRLDGDGYEIPADNPFVGRPDHREEIWVMGLRNPWQFSINRANGDVWIGDVGEDAREELNHVPAGTSGQNFGWYWFEGTRDRGIGGIPDGVELTPPVFEYDRSVGVSIIGGAVYHGTEIPELAGAVVFADMTGPFFALGSDGVARLDLRGGGVVTAFVETPDHELLVTTLERGLFRIRSG